MTFVHQLTTTLIDSLRGLPGRLIAYKLLAICLLATAVAEIALVTRVDTAVTREIHGWSAGWLTTIVSAISDLGGTDIVMWITAAALLALLVSRHWRDAAALALAVLSTQLIVFAAKAMVARPRPDDAIAIGDPSGWSFPSGHSATAVALYVTLGLIAATIWRRKVSPVLCFAIAGAIVVLVGASRVYLGAHYPSDVIAGWLTGGIIVAACWAALKPAQLAAAKPA